MNNKTTYTLKIDAEIDSLIGQINNAKKAMSGLGVTSFGKDMERQFGIIEKAIERLQQKASAPITSSATFGGLQKDVGAVSSSLKNLMSIISNFSNTADSEKLKLLPPDQQAKIEKAMAALVDYTSAIAKAVTESEALVAKREEEASASAKLEKALGKLADKQKILAEAQSRQATAKQAVDDAKKKVEALEAQEEAARKAAEEFRRVDELYEQFGGDRRKKADFVTPSGETINYQAAKKSAEGTVGPDPAVLEAAKTELAELEKTYSAATAEVTNFSRQVKAADTTVKTNQAAVTRLKQEVAALEASWKTKSVQDQKTAFDSLRTSAQQLGVSLDGIGTDVTEANIAELTRRLDELKNNGIETANAAVQNMEGTMSNAVPAVDNLSNAISQGDETFRQYDERVRQTTAMTERIKQFVGLQGAALVARKAVQSAMQTIKELDATMTEMAVVTDLGVGDYWSQLPEYTKRANDLGIAINDTYKAATLYYQQGLETNEVVAISNETLKMARIAGLDAEDATNKMTAALRGFNMELNETSAQKVADVYSELAAITASDVDEISSAMTKTASIASSAGMEFETTAAFLSQIIETTRESAETAGTAMKTVIARFQELKKDPAEIGEVDGEIVDANKIETALRSVGVALRDASGQFRDLDDVFLDLSSKWDGLDTNTQRYIATIAAGSRQQSRFIAMMSDYSRTQELVTAANSSAGASNEQFEKTLDSLDAKLNQLKNAWDSFTMGLMDSNVLKGAIELLTGILTVLNNLTDAFGAFSGVAKIGVVIAALYVGDKALKVFTSSLKEGSTVFQAFGATGRAAIDSINSRFLTLRKLFSAKLNVKIDSKEMKIAAKASQDYEAAIKDLKRIEVERAAAAKAGTLGDKEAAFYAQEAADATAKQSLAEKELMATMGLSAAQMSIVQGLEAIGISTESSLILTKAGLNAQMIVQAAHTYAMIPGVKALTDAEYGEQLATELQNASGLRAISTKLALTVANWAQTASEKAKTGTLWANITATIAQTMANWGLQASMWPILVVGLLLIAALATLVLTVVAVVAIFKAWKNSTPEAKMAALKKKTEAATKAAEEAKTAYEDILKLDSEYTTLNDQVDSLTEGTVAWKNAVAELNNQMMKLVELYPELLKYLQIAENGRMYFEDDGWDKLIEAQQKKANNAQARAYSAESDELAEWANQNGYKTKTIEVMKYYDKDNNEISATDAYNSNGGLKLGVTRKSTKKEVLNYGLTESADQQALEALSKLTWGTEEYDRAMVALKKSVKKTDEAQLAALDTFDDTAKQLAENAKKAEIYDRQVLALSGSLEAQESENYGRIISSLTENYADIEKDIRTAVDEKWKRKGKKGLWRNGRDKSTEGLLDELEKYNLTTRDSEKLDLAQLLAAKGGTVYTDEEIEEMGKDADDDLVAELKEYDMAISMGEEYVDKLYELQNDNALMGELYSGSLDINMTAIEQEAAELSKSNDKLATALNVRINTVKDARSSIDSELQKIYNIPQMTAEAFTGSYDQAQEFLNVYKDMLSSVGSELAQVFAHTFGILGEDRGQFLEQFGEVNWSSAIEGAAALKEALTDDDMAIRSFAQSSLELEKNFYSATSQANELYKTLGSEALKELGKDGEITSTEILELAQSNDKLNTMLENTGVSAATLGEYYELLEDGVLSVASATGDFVQVLDELRASSNAIEDSFAFIDNWEASRSGTEIGKSFTEMRDEMVELYNAGAYNDDALEDYINTFYGEDNWKKLLAEKDNDVKAALKTVMDQYQNFNDNFQSLWYDLANSGQIDGVSLGEKGSINFDFDQIASTEELKKQIMAQGYGEAMADALIADVQTYGLGIEEGLKQIDIKGALINWLNSSVRIVNGQQIIDEKQFQAFIEESGLNEETVRSALEASSIKIQGVLDEHGNLQAEIKEALLKTDENGQQILDFGQAYELMLDLGLNDTAAKKQLAMLAAEMSDVEFSLNGKSVQKSAAEAGQYVYNGQTYATEAALVDAYTADKVRLTQRKAALDQASFTGEAMIAANISASTLGTQAMATAIDGAINDLIEKVNFIIPGTEYDLKDTSFATDYVGANINDQISQATKQMQSYFKEQAAATDAELKKLENFDFTGGEDIYKTIMENSGGIGGGVAYDPNENPVGTVTGSDKYDSPYDRIYNLNKKVNALLREREKLEQQYQKELRKEEISAQELFRIRQRQLALLNQEKVQQERIVNQAQSNAHNLIQQNYKYNGLYGVNTETGEVEVNYTKVASIFKNNQEGGEAFEEFISKLEEQYDIMREAEDRLSEIEEDTEEIQNQGREELENIYDQVKEALVQERQDEIDKLQSINDSIQEMQDQLVSRMEQQINDARQARDNQKAEEDLQEKQNRLSYLMMDTSGGNDAEIAALQEELLQGEQDYQDSQIDQALERLQSANEKAAEQRQQQIDIAQAQLDAYVESGVIWDEVRTIVTDSLAKVWNGEEFLDTEAGKLIQGNMTGENPYATEKELEELNANGAAAASAIMAELDKDQKAEEPEFEYKDLYIEFKVTTSGGQAAPAPLLNPTIPNKNFNVRAYATGGLADSTGPAWLDGTRSKPEYVLNAEQTARFFELVDVLKDVDTSKTPEGSRGDNYFDIQISVESIEDDYDVEQLANKIRSMIYDDATYRNVNAVHQIR